MELTAEETRQAILLFEGTALAGDEAAALAALLESTEELLAHLLLKRGSFGRHPGLAARMAERARAWHAQARSARPHDAPLGAPPLERRRALEAALAASIAHDQGGYEAARAVAEAWRAWLAEPAATAARPAQHDFDLHLRFLSTSEDAS